MCQAKERQKALSLGFAPCWRIFAAKRLDRSQDVLIPVGVKPLMLNRLCIYFEDFFKIHFSDLDRYATVFASH